MLYGSETRTQSRVSESCRLLPKVAAADHEAPLAIKGRTRETGVDFFFYSRNPELPTGTNRTLSSTAHQVVSQSQPWGEAGGPWDDQRSRGSGQSIREGGLARLEGPSWLETEAGSGHAPPLIE